MVGEVLGVAADAGEQAGLERVHPVQAEEVEAGTAVTPRCWIGRPSASTTGSRSQSLPRLDLNGAVHDRVRQGCRPLPRFRYVTDCRG
jgi:hypothetical protein